MKRWLSILLALALVITPLTGCGGSETPGETGGGPAPQSEATEPAQPGEPSDTPDEADEPDDPYYVSLPLTEENQTLSIWMPDAPHVYAYVDDLDEASISQRQLQLETNITLEFTRHMEAEVGLSLVIAGGDWPDMFIMGADYYPGGASKGAEEGVFRVLDDVLETELINYNRLLEEDPDLNRQARTADGKIVSLYTVYTEVSKTGNGPLVRGDWLDNFGMSISDITTIEDYHSYLTRAKNEYGAQLYLQSSAVPYNNWLVGTFGVAGFISDTLQRYPFYQENGVVKFGILEQGYYDYMSLMRDWYSEGLITDEFLNWTLIHAGNKDIIVGGKVSMFYWGASIAAQLPPLSPDPDFMLVGVSEVTDGIKNPFGDNGTRLRNSVEVSNETDNLELTLKFINYGYSERGSTTWSYGQEGLSFEYDENGKPQYTEYMHSRDDGMDLSLTSTIFTCSNVGPHTVDSGYMLPYYTKETVDAMELWDSCVDFDNTCNLPPTLQLSQEDSNTFNSMFGDILTYMSESIPQFMMGGKSLETDWEPFIAECRRMGIEDCIAMYQRAYDRYMSL